MLELKDRLPRALAGGGRRPATPVDGDELRDDLLSALVNLGYHRPLAEKAVDAALKAIAGRRLRAARCEQALRRADAK